MGRTKEPKRRSTREEFHFVNDAAHNFLSTGQFEELVEKANVTVEELQEAYKQYDKETLFNAANQWIEEGEIDRELFPKIADVLVLAYATSLVSMHKLDGLSRSAQDTPLEVLRELQPNI